MSLQVLDTIASLITVTIVAATAVAALVQLRHLRAGNQIHAILSVGEKLDGREFSAAIRVLKNGLEAALADKEYRDYEIASFRYVTLPQVEQRYVELHQAAILLGNTFDLIGLLVKNRIVDATIFVDQYCGITTGAWKRLANYIALARAAAGTENVWENFEYLAVISEDWMRSNVSSYPKGVRKLELHNPWPVPKAD
jgi:hypothetical protein